MDREDFGTMLIGYARVSTTDQKPELQVDALLKPSVDRPQLAKALAYATDGDVLVVWRLDRLGHSLLAPPD
jgi:DNA invertase Pin-like site-specific DNA recombinase